MTFLRCGAIFGRLATRSGGIVRSLCQTELDMPASARMIRHFGLLDLAARQHPGLFAPAAPLGVYVVTLTRWAALYPKDARRWMNLTGFPALEALARAQEARVETPVIARSEGLGPHPFTRPEQANPPEGSVL